MGIGTSSSSSGASAPRANAYAINRDASELGRSPAQKAPASAQPGPMHVIYMSVTTATHRPTVIRPDTWRDKKETAPGPRFRSERAVFAGGGRCAGRTNVGRGEG